MLVTSLLLLSLLSPPVQDRSAEGEGGFRIGVAVDQVFLSVNARAMEGGFVRGLNREQLRIREDGVEQKIVNFYSQGVPVHVVLLVDISGSTRQSQGEIQQAALGFARSLSKEDRIAVVAFSDAPRLVLDWTDDIEKVENALLSSYAKGPTVLNDALYVAFDDLLEGAEGKKAVIVLTDGIDTNSMVDKQEVLELAVRSQAVVYVVSKLEEYWAGAIAARNSSRMPYIPRQMKDPFILEAKRFLGRLAGQTGGKVLPGSSGALVEVYRQVAEELKNQYYISYTPTNKLKDGRWRNIEVMALRPGVIVSARPGYYAPRQGLPE